MFKIGDEKVFELDPKVAREGTAYWNYPCTIISGVDSNPRHYVIGKYKELADAGLFVAVLVDTVVHDPGASNERLNCLWRPV